MRKNTLYTAMIALVASGSIASAEHTHIQPLVAYGENPDRPFTPKISLGYFTNYKSYGMVMDNTNAGNSIPLALDVQYAFNKKYAVVAGAKYDEFIKNGFLFDHDRSGLCDEIQGYIGVGRQWTKTVHTALAYQVTHGGMMNIFHPPTGEEDHWLWKSTDTEGHSIVLDFTYDRSQTTQVPGKKLRLPGLFVQSRTELAVQWVSGWWFSNTVGYKYDFNDRVTGVLSATWDASANYFKSDAYNANGTQGINVKFELPIAVTKHFTVSPSLSTVWLGNGGIAANKRYNPGTDQLGLRGRGFGSDLYRNFTLLAGVNCSYTF